MPSIPSFIPNEFERIERSNQKMEIIEIFCVVLLTRVHAISMEEKCEIPDAKILLGEDEMDIYTIDIAKEEIKADGEDKKTYKLNSREKLQVGLNSFLLPYRSRVRVNIPEDDNISLASVNTSDFKTCTVSNGIVLNADNGTVHLNEDERDVDAIFILGNCKYNLKINITFKANECKTNKSHLCSRHGHCFFSYFTDSFVCRCCDMYTGVHCDGEINGNISKGNETVFSTSQLIYDKAHLKDLCIESGICNTGNISSIDKTSNILDIRCSEEMLCPKHMCVNGVCIETKGNKTCFCRSGYYGNLCEIKINECMSQPCKNDGVCKLNNDGYTCVCALGYTGLHCDQKIHPCEQNPCLNRGTCAVQGTSYMCKCPAGFTGHTCETEEDECLSNPCKYNGFCQDYVNAYLCICTETHAGPNCEITIDMFERPINTELSPVSGHVPVHNLYIIVAVSGSIVLVISIVIVICYCKTNRTYKTISLNRLVSANPTRSCSSSSLEVLTVNRPRLSIDALWETSSLQKDGLYHSTDICSPLVTKEV